MDVKGLKISLLAFQVKVNIRIGAHEEQIVLDVAPIGMHQLILGLPWLEAHDPTIQWHTGHIQFSSQHCNLHCLPTPHAMFAKNAVIALTDHNPHIPITCVTPKAKILTRGSKDSAGWDLYSIENVTFKPGHQTLIDTSISITLPKGTYGHITPCSGLAWKHGVTVGAGVIDRDYTGTLKVLLFNQGTTTMTLQKGDHIAQLILEKYNSDLLKEVNQIPNTERDTVGFGSMGISYMEPNLVDIYTINLMPMASEETICAALSPEYHHKAHMFDPEGPLKQQPCDRLGKDFKLQLDPTKPLPKPSQPYHMNPVEWQDWMVWRDTMLNASMISKAPANTPLAAPFFFIWKKDSTWQPVIDYQKLNDITIKDSLPLPCINETLEHMHGAKFFSKFNLKMGYNQLSIKKEDQWKTAFMTPDSPYVMNVMMFGFANAPVYFQQWMSEILKPVVGLNMVNYLDNTGTFNNNLPEHIQTNLAVLDCFNNHGMFLNLNKCLFHQWEMNFLGVDILDKGFEMEKPKVEAIEEWKPPKNVWGVREFVGFCNFYCHFIKLFLEIACPLHNLMKVGQLWTWGEKEQCIFNMLKWIVTEALVLIHANPNKKFQMETDASSYTYGTVLSQKAEDKKHHLVAFYSKSMNPTEQNYRISNKEGLSIIKGLQHWRHWLEGTKEPVCIITNHHNLEYFKNPHPLNWQQLQWLEQLTHYNYKITYWPRDKNSVADALLQQEQHHPEQPDEKCYVSRFLIKYLALMYNKNRGSLNAGSK